MDYEGDKLFRDSACKEETRLSCYLTRDLEKYAIQTRTRTRSVQRLSGVLVYQRVSYATPQERRHKIQVHLR
jgi:hypothetical protein